MSLLNEYIVRIEMSKQLGFDREGSDYKPNNCWYLPKDTNAVAIVCEATQSDKDIKNNDKQRAKIHCNCNIQRTISRISYIIKSSILKKIKTSK